MKDLILLISLISFLGLSEGVVAQKQSEKGVIDVEATLKTVAKHYQNGLKEYKDSLKFPRSIG